MYHRSIPLHLKAFRIIFIVLLTLPKQHVLGSAKLKAFADDNFKFDENGVKLTKRLENKVGKGEIAPCKQFLLFPQCFLKTSSVDK